MVELLNGLVAPFFVEDKEWGIALCATVFVFVAKNKKQKQVLRFAQDDKLKDWGVATQPSVARTGHPLRDDAHARARTLAHQQFIPSTPQLATGNC